MTDRLLAPPKQRHNVNVWVDEAIWGHRFYNDQTPWLVLLEFLAIFRSRQAEGTALNEKRANGLHESFEYSVPRLIPLRHLVFNNPHIRHVESTHKSEPERWREWLARVETDGDFRYLQDRFRHYEHLARVVEFFQATAIEPHRQRRWSSRFIFPYGPNCLYADLPANVRSSPDRRFFARGGELLYLMLNRSGQGPELAELISKKLLQEESTWNQVVSVLLPSRRSVDTDLVSSDIGYLPFLKRREYTALAETWFRLLGLDLGGEALLESLMRLTTLHMLLYLLRRGNEEVGDTNEPKIVLEIASPKRTALFDLSAENLRANRMLSSRAVRAHVEAAKNDRRWKEALRARSPTAGALSFLEARFAWNPTNEVSVNSPNALFQSLLDYSDTRHQQHVAKVHMEWARQIGLAVSRRGAGSWYSPDDALLKALVICGVDEGREEYHRFLGKIFDQFKLVIGPNEAETAFGALPTDQNVFLQNVQRLEQRLKTLGLLRRLSDDCAYVENPFGSKS